MIDANLVTEKLDRMVKAGLLERVKSRNEDEFTYQVTELAKTIKFRLQHKMPLDLYERKALNESGISEKDIME